MAQQTGNGNKKRGPGRPPGSRNKTNKNTAAYSGNPTKQEVLDEMKRRSDKDKRNLDIIWSITLFAIGLFLFFTVVMDTTGSFGMKVHDICRGLFGIMAFALPFLVFIYAWLLLRGRLQHIGARTAIFSVLIFINMCILNSYRFIDVNDLRYGFGDIADYYVAGVDGQKGGAIGMELGSILAKLFGMPGLIIIALAVLTISVFLVANTPISRFAANIGNKAENRRMLKELEKDEQRRISDEEMRAALAAPAAGTASSAADIPKPFGSRAAKKEEKDHEIEYTQIMDSPLDSKEQLRSNTFFGRIKGYFAGIDSETGKPVSADTLARSQEEENAKAAYENERQKNRQRVINGGSRSVPAVDYSENRDFEKEEPDYGYPGRKRTAGAGSAPAKGLGLGDPDEIVHSGSYGLDAHGMAAAGRAETVANFKKATEGLSFAGGNAAGNMGSKAEPSVRQVPAKKTAPAVKEKKPETPETTAADLAEDAAIAAGFSSNTDDGSYELPPVSLLKKDTNSKQLMSNIQLEERADLLEQTLNDFGVDAKVLTVTQGASVTRYEVQPATGVKVSRITSLADDIALNLRAKSIRIEAPIPGKAAVGIEVENEKPSPVLIRELIDSEEFRNARSKIEFVVGKDISGNNIVADLRDMPHLLIAGATGSGKSVCINTIITSFLYKAKPSELKLIMVDPKVVELGNYNGIPHMLTPVVTDPRKASRALAIAVEEMDRRYELFAENNVKDLESYNELMRANHRFADCKPQIVIIIDELADLMMAAPSEVESSICRLAQKARAAGMHLIVATQRPSVDVVTGLIKANIPSRIAFSVASQFDSRTILDMAGAEKLLGKGDMLFSPVGSTKPYRVQGPFISEKETDKIIKFVKKTGGTPAYDEELRNAIENSDKKAQNGPQDELTDDAIAFIFKSKQASVSMLQRRFRIGYNRAARIIDEIEEKGIIGPSDGSRPRQLLITEEEYYGGHDDSAESVPEVQKTEESKENVRESKESRRNGKEAEAEVGRAEGETKGAGADAAGNSGTSAKLSHTQAMDSFNSLPESVRRMVMDADSSDEY